MTCDVRLQRIVGLPAILGEKQVGHVERAALEADGRRLRGLVIRRGMGSARWVDRKDVSVVGEVSVVLKSPPGRPPRDADTPPQRVTDESGLTLGRVTDAWLHPDTLEVTAIEVTLGPIEDLRRGRLRVHSWALQRGCDGMTRILIGRKDWEVLT